MILRPLLPALLALLVPAALLAQASTPVPGSWTRADGRIRFAASGISFPERPGAVALYRAAESGSYGPGLDNFGQYESADRQIIATVYVYAPNLPHAGFSAYATDTFLRAHAELAPRQLGSRLTGAGGLDGAAIRIDYAGYRGNMASSAAFLKLGQWIVKLRVTGPEARRAEVDRTMTALLDEMRFEGALRPRPPEPLDISPCGSPANRRAALLPSEDAETLAEALIGSVESDRQPRERDGASILTPRFGRAWCLSGRIGQANFPVLRSLMPGEGARQRSVLVVPLSDAGRSIEVVETQRRGRFAVFFHEIGRTELWGAFDGIPTDEQIAAFISGADRAGRRVRAVIERGADGNADVQIQRTAPAPVQPQT